MVVPRLASLRLASCQQKKDARTLPGPADVAATSNGLPMSPRARNSVTVRAVDIADAYSMSDGSSPRGAGERGCQWAGTGGRWQGLQSTGGQVRFLDEKMQRGSKAMLFNMYESHLGVTLSLYKWKRSPTAIRSASGLHPWIAMQLDDLESLHLIRGKGGEEGNCGRMSR